MPGLSLTALSIFITSKNFEKTILNCEMDNVLLFFLYEVIEMWDYCIIYMFKEYKERSLSLGFDFIVFK